MQGERSNARFHGQDYDATGHLPRLAELLVNYFQVVHKPEHIHRLRSLDESALLRKYQALDTSRLTIICQKYTLRLFQPGVTGPTKKQMERKLGEVNENEQLAGVWPWILRLGFELSPDNRPQLVFNSDGTLANKGGERPVKRPKQRPCFTRDRTWLEWYDDQNGETYHSPANIRDKWNGMSQKERIRISINASNKIGEKRIGQEVVKKAIEKAQKELASAET